MLLALRALPHTPGHDGVRLFLPAFGMLAIVAGLGAAAVVGRFGRFGQGLIVLAIAEGVASVALMMPVPLSYFSPIVGGLPGRRGWGWSRRTSGTPSRTTRSTGSTPIPPPGRSVRFATFPTSWLYLKQTGKLRSASAPIDPGKPIWYVLQNRPGAFSPTSASCSSAASPRFVVSKLGVPLVLIYPFPD